MRKFFITLCLLIIVVPETFAEADDFGIWSTVNVKYNFTKKIYGSTLFEFRSKENTQRMDCFISRQYLGYNWTSWLKSDVAYDFITTPSSVHNRFLFSVTGTLKEGNFSFSLRERYLYDYTVKSHSGENVLRSKASVHYHIPNTIFSPYMAIELFTWEHWKKTRHYAGTKIKLTDQSSLDIFYMYYTKRNKTFEQHLLGIGYILKI